MDKNILKQLKSDYEEREIKPSVDLWEQIDAALENKSDSSQKASFSLGWWKYAAVVLLLISVGTLIYYNHGFSTEKTDYIVKQNLKKEVLKTENNSEIIPEEENPIIEITSEIVKKTDLKVEQNDNKDILPRKEIIKPQILEPTETNIVVNQPEKQIDHQEKMDNMITPPISDTKKISYVTASELLLGNELDKTREKSKVETRNFGVIHLNKVLPNLGNVTVLGVTVYVDPK